MSSDAINGIARRVSTPSGPSRKRKGQNSDCLDVSEPSTQDASQADPEQDPTPDNWLLAGYLAHEYLTKGTIFGQPWDQSKRLEPTKPGSYAEVAQILKTDGAHIPGVVNPSQLTSWLQK